MCRTPVRDAGGTALCSAGVPDFRGSLPGGPAAAADQPDVILTPSTAQNQLLPPVYRNRTCAVETPAGTWRASDSLLETVSEVYVFTERGAAPS